MRVSINQALAAGVQAAATEWNITPPAAARRVLKKALQEHGHLPPPPVHRTLRLTTSMIQWIQHTAQNTGVPQSEMIRQLLTEGLAANPTPHRKVTYPDPTPKRITLRLPPDLHQAIQTQANTWETQWSPTATHLILAAYLERRKNAKTK